MKSVRLVPDASAAVEYLLRTPRGRAAANLFDAADLLVAPHLLDAEALAVLRTLRRTGAIAEDQAVMALANLTLWPVERVAHGSLFTSAWSLRHNVTAYDALYVATAKHYAAALVTADGPLGRAPNLGVVVHDIR